MEQETFECDVLVVGTGASGMSTAVTAASQGLKVLVVEKEPRFGGTTARSGGWLWIPGTRLATEQGINEPAGAAREYLKHETTTHFDAARVDAFLENGPKAIDFFTRNTPRAVRHAGRVPRLPRRGHRRPTGRPFHGRAAVRRPRARQADQAPGAGASGADGVRNDVGLGQGDQTLHASVQVARVLRLRDEAPGPAHARRAAPRPRHDADQRQCAGRQAGQGGDGPGHSGLALSPVQEARRRARRRRRRDRPQGRQARARQREARRRPRLRRLSA